MFHYSQIVKYKATGKLMAYKNYKDRVYQFVDEKGEGFSFFDFEVKKDDFEEIFEYIKIGGRTPIKFLKRTW